MKLRLLQILFIVAGSHLAWAQPTNFTKSDHWKHQRKELIFGIGASNFLGDLGGLNRIGTDYTPIDMEWSLTRPSGHFGYRYRFRPMWATKSFLQYGLLHGDDKLTNEPSRNYRKLRVRTHLFEFSQHLELILFNNEQFGKRIHGSVLLVLLCKIAYRCYWNYVNELQFLLDKFSWYNIRSLV